MERGIGDQNIGKDKYRRNFNLVKRGNGRENAGQIKKLRFLLVKSRSSDNKNKLKI